ncbi:P2X purinoceptor 4-like [Paramacrobiotus metropolitanus]|uniref:P2X purinoceptor 4-like n=1 Tax=Paramacrobiotus metropolitanus TaxID=2943436 RepID=UPI002445676B|nr:P2X purinoceptor 4-like [Paramacrobiotus metropolitanus]
MASRPGSVFWRNCLDTFTKYETGRTARFNEPFIAICNRIIQCIILVYVFGYVLLADKGYQEIDNGESSVVTKVKGNQKNIRRGHTGQNMFSPTEGITWDAADYVYPPLENNALFIMTRFTITEKQNQGKCAERNDPSTQKEARCVDHTDCLLGKPVHLGHGFHTGKCVYSTGTCEVFAWCPIEKDTNEAFVWLDGGQNLTILVKNFVLFPKWGIRRRNIGDLSATHLKDCKYKPKKDPLCPIFVLGDIVELAKENFTEMALHGAILNFAITWDCNLDRHIQNCVPQYSFRRLDNGREAVAPGWDFWYSGYWLDKDNEPSRFLIKATGIRIVFTVYAKARKFSIVKTTMNLGAGLGLLFMASMICDYMLFYCGRPREREIRGAYASVDAEEIKNENASNNHKNGNYHYRYDNGDHHNGNPVFL